MPNNEIIEKDKLNNSFSDAVNALQCGIAKLTADSKWQVKYANDIFYEIIDCTPEDFERKYDNSISRLVHSNDLEILRRKVEQQIITTGKFAGQYRIVTDKGEVRDVLDKSVPAGDGKYFYTTFVDVTEQVAAHRHVEELQHKFVTAANHANLYFWEIDVRKGVVTFGKNAVEDFRLPETCRFFSRTFLKLGYLAKESTDEFNRMCREVNEGQPLSEGYVRLSPVYGGGWFHVRNTVRNNELGEPVSAFGTAENVDAFKQLENVFYTASEVQGICIWTVDLTTGKGFQPDYMRKKYGYSGYIENIEKTMIESGSIHPEDVEVYQNMFRRVRGGVPQVEGRYRKRNILSGAYDWFKVNFITVYDKACKPSSIICAATNINAQVEAEEKYSAFINYRKLALKNTLATFRVNLTQNEVIEAQSDRFDIVDMTEDGTVDGIFEYAKDRLRSDYNAERIAASFSRGRLIEKFTTGEISLSAECRYLVHRNASPIWMRVTVEMIENPITADIEALIYAVDINKEKTTDALIKMIVDTDYDYISLIDAETGVLSSYGKGIDDSFPHDGEMYNERLLEICREYLPPDSKDEAFASMNLEAVLKQLEDRKLFSYTAQFMLHKEERYKTWKYRYLDDAKRQILFIRYDVTDSYGEQQRQQKVLKKALANAEAANIAKSEFLSRISHDMRTPMNGILGLIVLTKNEEMSDVMRENIRKMEDSGQYLLRLINDTLDMNRIETKKIELNNTPTESSAFFESLISSVKPSIDEKCITFVYSKSKDKHPDTMWINLDKVRVQQVFTNIISNAVKFTPVGGRIEFKVETEKCDDRYVYDKFTISDTGIGMSEAFLHKIFIPFEQEYSSTTSKYAGTGLGMAIVKNLVEIMDGKIEVTSQKNVGTEVTIWMKFERVEQPVEEKPDVKKNVELDNCRILISEDHPLNAEIAKRLLVSRNCKVEHATDGDMCVKMFEASPAGYYDLILMDIRMPVMDGLTATRNIRASSHPDAKRIPIIAMTANAFDEDVQKSMDAGMNAHLAKPIAPKLMFDTIAEHLGKK